jgi:hypothetical protein
VFKWLGEHTLERMYLWPGVIKFFFSLIASAALRLWREPREKILWEHHGAMSASKRSLPEGEENAEGSLPLNVSMRIDE